MLDQLIITFYQMWVWMKYEVSVHPFLFAGIVIVIALAIILYKSEVEGGEERGDRITWPVLGASLGRQ